MVKVTWRILALSALMGAVALPATAQVVVGESGRPSVEVNWAVLDSLGRQPTLADMLKNDMPVKTTATAKLPGAPQGIAYRPYQPQGDKPAAKPVAKPVVGEAKKPRITPVAAKSDVPVAPAVSQLVRAAQVAPPPVKAESVKPEPVKAEPVKSAGPQISLPEIKPVAAPMQIAKVEPAPAPVVAAPVPAAPVPAAPVVAAPAPIVPPTVVKPEPALQVAALPSPAVVVGKGDTTSILFNGEDAKLPGDAQSALQALAKRMEKDEGLGLQLLAYATGDDAGASKARRLSLSRALEVRKFLMEQGVRSTRIEVRALGNKLEGAGPADRVDAVVVSR